MLEGTNLFLDPDQIVDSQTCFFAIEELSNQLNSLSSDIRNVDFSEGVYIWGSEEVARRVAILLRNVSIPLLGVFDTNPEKLGKSFESLIITLPKKVSKFVIVCSYHQPEHLISARNIIGDKAVGAWELLILRPDIKGLPWNNLRHPNELSEWEKSKINEVAARCVTETRSEFWKQVAARHLVSILHSNQIGQLPISQEYFVQEIIETDGESVFLDLGAYSGDTLERFFSQKISGPDSRKAIGVEADQKNFSLLLDKYGKDPNVTLFNAAISDTQGLIGFSESDNSMGSSALFFEANNIVPSITIDEIYSRLPFTHVKFDIEGFERNALAGAIETIKKSGLVWSVASYHLYDDIWVLPEFFPDVYEIVVTRHATLPWDTTFHFRIKN
jgi:FkbM family methyltransferase